MPISRKDADRIRYARKKADVNVIDFNDWLQKEYGCKLSELEPEKVEDVIAGIVTVHETSHDTSDETSKEPMTGNAKSFNDITFDPDKLTQDQREEIIVDEKRELGKAGRHPYVLFHFSNPWNVPRLADLMELFTRKKETVHFRLEFRMDDNRITLQEHEAIRKLRTAKNIYEHHTRSDGKEDILIVDDPAVPVHDKYVAPLRYGVQTGLPRITPSLVSGIKRLTQYFTWGKRDKADLKQAGVSGSLLTISGSPWLSYLSFLVARGDCFDAGTAVLYPPLEHIGCKQFWQGSGVIRVLAEMKCKIIIIRHNRRDPNWLPQQYRLMDYLEPLNAADEIPRYCIAPRGIPLVEPAALKIPTLRLRPGQVITPKMLKACGPEKLPDRYISINASYRIFRDTMRPFYAQWQRQADL